MGITASRYELPSKSYMFFSNCLLLKFLKYFQFTQITRPETEYNFCVKPFVTEVKNISFRKSMKQPCFLFSNQFNEQTFSKFHQNNSTLKHFLIDLFSHQINHFSTNKKQIFRSQIPFSLLFDRTKINFICQPYQFDMSVFSNKLYSFVLLHFKLSSIQLLKSKISRMSVDVDQSQRLI